MDGLPSLHPQAPCMQAHHLFSLFLLLRPQIMSLAGCLVLSLVLLKRQKPWRVDALPCLLPGSEPRPAGPRSSCLCGQVASFWAA